LGGFLSYGLSFVQFSQKALLLFPNQKTAVLHHLDLVASLPKQASSSLNLNLKTANYNAVKKNHISIAQTTPLKREAAHRQQSHRGPRGPIIPQLVLLRLRIERPLRESAQNRACGLSSSSGTAQRPIA